MAWIDNKNAYDMVLQSWIINSLKMYKISYETINFIEKTMKKWRVELTAGGKGLAEKKDPRRDFPKRCIVTPTIHNCHEATKSHTQKMHGLIQT